MRKIVIATTLALGALTTGGATLATAAPSATSSCQLITWAPFMSGSSTVKGTIGRSGCTNNATWEGSLKRDIEWAPDRVAATGSGSGNNTVTLSAACSVAGSGWYYTEVHSSTGATQQSGRYSRC